MDYNAFHESVVPTTREAAEAIHDATGVWPHALGRQGAELAKDARQGRLWKHQGAVFARVGHSLAQTYQRFKGDPDTPPIQLQWRAGTAPRKIQIAGRQAHTFLEDLYRQQLRDGGYARTHFTGMLQKPSEERSDGGLYRFFLELDEKVDDLDDLARNDAWVETYVGALLETLWPGRWWGWVRPTELRARGEWRREQGVRSWVAEPGWKGGLHVHVDAWVTRALARQVYDWIQSMLADHDAYFETGERSLVGRPAGLVLDPVSWNGTGLRLNGAYKHVGCSPYLHDQTNGQREANCVSGCPSCHGTSELLDAPPYWPTRDDTWATFLRCSVAPPADPTLPTPLPGWFEVGRRALVGNRFQTLRTSDRGGFEALEGVRAWIRRNRSHEVVEFHSRAVEAAGRQLPLDLNLARDGNGRAYLIAQWTGNRACWFLSKASQEERRAALRTTHPGQESHRRAVRLVTKCHTSMPNYLVFRADGSVSLRCRSPNRDICRHGVGKGSSPAWTGDRPMPPLEDTEGRLLFGDDWAPDGRPAKRLKASLEGVVLTDLFMGG